MTKLIIIRHGNTFDKGDVVLRAGSRTDLPLSSSGHAQAEKLGTHLKDQGLLPDLVLTSHLKRTKETAARALAAIGHTCPTTPRPELNEIDYGIDDGKPETEVTARLGQQTLTDWDKKTIMPPEWSPRPDQICANLCHLFNDFKEQGHSTIWLVTSNGIARFIPELCKTSGPVDIKLKTAAYGSIDLRDDGLHLLNWGVTAP